MAAMAASAGAGALVAISSARARASSSAARAAAGAAAGPRRLRLALGVGNVSKSAQGPGEDAYFASYPLGAFGVADGVGSWAREGVDSGLFSRGLLQHTHAGLTRRAQGTGSARPDLPGTARSAFEAVLREEIRGSSTLILVQLHLDMLSVMNLGDCGLLALRPIQIQSRFFGGTPEAAMRIMYRSSPMLHRPNLPLQLSCEDEDHTEALEHADLISLRLRRGDIVIAGSDGLFDNVQDFELESIALAQHTRLSEAQSDVSLAESLAATLTQHAAERARAAPESGYGGKLDDVTVVVACAEEWTPAVAGGLIENFDERAEESSTVAAHASPPDSARTSIRSGGAAALAGVLLQHQPSSSVPRSQSAGRSFATTAAAPGAAAPAVCEGTRVQYRIEAAAPGASVVEACVDRLLGRGSYASAWQLQPSDGARPAVLKCFEAPDPAAILIYGRGMAEEAAEQLAREKRAGEVLLVGAKSHTGQQHIARLLSTDPILAVDPGGEQFEHRRAASAATKSPTAMLVFEHAGQALERPAALAAIGFHARCEVIRQLLRAVALLRIHGIVHMDINAENCGVDELGQARLFDFGNAFVLEAARDRSAVHPRLKKLHSKYVHHPKFPAAERYAHPLPVGQLIATVEHPCGIDPYAIRYDPEQFPGNCAATPPEVLRGRVVPGASDVYGLGVLLWWLLTGTETMFEVDVELDRVRFDGWAHFFRLPEEERRDELRRRLRAELLPELQVDATTPQDLQEVADWMLGAFAEAPEGRAAALLVGPLGQHA